MGKSYGSIGTGPVQSVPVNVSVPLLSGTETLGQVLTATTGEWTGWPKPWFTFRWIRGASTAIAGATASTYTIVADDQTTTVKCGVTGISPMGTSAEAVSLPTGTIP